MTILVTQYIPVDSEKALDSPELRNWDKARVFFEQVKTVDGDAIWTILDKLTQTYPNFFFQMFRADYSTQYGPVANGDSGSYAIKVALTDNPDAPGIEYMPNEADLPNLSEQWFAEAKTDIEDEGRRYGF